MPMRTLFTAILMMLVFAAGCSQEDEVLPKQQETIVKFLTGSHKPPLISEADKQQSIDRDPPYYTISGSTVYRYISNVYEEGRDQRPMVVRGVSVTITFRAYIFEGKIITDDVVPYYTNDHALEQIFYEKWGLTPGLWVFEPLTIVLGESQIIKGLEDALLGCREGDIVEAYMTYNMAYGDKNFSVIPQQSPVVYHFTVSNVE